MEGVWAQRSLKIMMQTFRIPPSHRGESLWRDRSTWVLMLVKALAFEDRETEQFRGRWGQWWGTLKVMLISEGEIGRVEAVE